MTFFLGLRPGLRYLLTTMLCSAVLVTLFCISLTAGPGTWDDEPRRLCNNTAISIVQNSDKAKMDVFLRSANKLKAEKLVERCVEKYDELFAPCHEFKARTDSALNCMLRRGDDPYFYDFRDAFYDLIENAK